MKTNPVEQRDTNNNEEENTEMDEGMNYNLLRCSSSSRTRKMLKTFTDFDSLPEELLMQILLHIPAQDIFDAAIFVSRRWFHIVKTHNFKFAHLHHSTPGLLIRHREESKNSFMSMTKDGQIEISAFTYNPECHFGSSCNGLLLEPDFHDKYELVITNPVTKQHLALPPFTLYRALLPKRVSAIAFVATRMEYKVVRAYYKGDQNPNARVYCGILTVGVDNSWRVVDTKHLPFAASRLLQMWPLVTEGFVHWAPDVRVNHVLSLRKQEGFITAPMRNNYILTMNMETEIITMCPTPEWSGGYYYHKYFSGGKCLSLMIGRGYLKWEVWEMEPETREWARLPDIDLEAHKDFLNESYDREERYMYKPDEGACLDCKLAPAGWLKYREVIIFAVYRPTSSGFNQARLRAVYNVQTEEFFVFDFDYSGHPFLVHTNSLMGIS